MVIAAKNIDSFVNYLDRCSQGAVLFSRFKCPIPANYSFGVSGENQYAEYHYVLATQGVYISCKGSVDLEGAASVSDTIRATANDKQMTFFEVNPEDNIII